jgi:DNA-directed RNA polymerase specialized sigma24 family protein
MHANGNIPELLEAVYRDESRRILATLIRLLGDFDLAEDALHDAFKAALEQWPRDGVPAQPRAWLVSAGRFKAIDRLRRRAPPTSEPSPSPGSNRRGGFSNGASGNSTEARLLRRDSGVDSRPRRPTTERTPGRSPGAPRPAARRRS